MRDISQHEAKFHERVSEMTADSLTSAFICVHRWFRNKPVVIALSLFLLSTCLVPATMAQFSDVPPPAQPLRAWTLAIDGTVLVVDAENRLYRLGVSDLAVEARSEPLFDAFQDDRITLAGDYTQVFVGSQTAGRTLVLDISSFEPKSAPLSMVGPMAADPLGRLFLISEGDIWAYKLSDPAAEPQKLVVGPRMGLGLVPVDLWANRDLPFLYVRLHDNSASPPHQREFFRVYDPRNMSELGLSEGQLGTLSRPGTAKLAGSFLSTLYAKSPFYSANTLLFFDSKAGTAGKWQPFDGMPALSPDGLYVYLMRQRGLWVLSGMDMSVLSVLPFTERPPADVLISPYGERLYLLGNGWLQALDAAALPSAGILPVSPFPLAWTDDTTNHRPWSQAPEFRAYPSPQMEQYNTALVQVGGYGETYRSTDGGRTWELLTSLTYPHIQETPALSLSPEFAADRTVVGRFTTTMRSRDAGETWAEWSPRIAFVSDRTGNREIYTMSQDGSDIRQVTSNSAADETPAWSPAWTYIAFQSNRSGNLDVFSISADCDGATGETDACRLRQLTDDPADDMLPAWSPDGRTIAFVSTRDGNPEIYVMDHDGQNPRRVTFNPTGDWRPAWMPDSAHLLFASDRDGDNDIYSIAAPLAGEHAPTSEVDLEPVVGETGDDRDPAVNGWSQLLFLSDRSGVMKAYELDLKSQYATARPVSEGQGLEGHPTWQDHAQGYRVLLTLERDGATNIYDTCSVCEYRALTEGDGFNGHPAWGPVWWQPDLSSSVNWLIQSMK